MRIGISYSWDGNDHEDWVFGLARRLEEAGFEIEYDRRQRLGADSPQFMEKMVLDTDRVLVICSTEYKIRVDERARGAGHEGALISSELVRNHGTIKFIPILREGSWDNAVPRCLGGRMGLDMRDNAHFEDKFRDLIEDLERDATSPTVPPQVEKCPAKPPIRISSAETALALDGADRVTEAISALAAQNHKYHRIVRMNTSPASEKHHNALVVALRGAIVWHGDHPWPASLGMIESLLKVGEEETKGPYLEKILRPESVGYELRMDQQQRYEYVEVRRNCSITIVETEDFHWFRRGQLMFDEAIGSVSDAMRFCSKFYELLLGANDCEFEITWFRADGLRLTVMEEQFIPRARSLLVSPRVCRHDSPIRSELLRAGTIQFRQSEHEFVSKRQSIPSMPFGGLMVQWGSERRAIEEIEATPESGGSRRSGCRV